MPSHVDEDAPEDAPLLDDDERHDEPLPTWPRIRARSWQAKTPGSIVLLAAAVMFCVTSSGMLMLIPLYRLIEDALCHAHYADSSHTIIDEMQCKGDEVQSRLAYVLGWFGLFNSIMTLLVSFPFALLADRIGRKPTALMAYGGTALSFCFAPFMLGKMQASVRNNPYLLMIGSLFLLLGGGVPTLLATVYAMAADVSSEQETAASFLYLSFGSTAGALIGPMLAGLLMEKYGPWIPVYVVLAVTPAILCIFFFIPETLVARPGTPSKAQLVDIKELVGSGLRDLGRSLELVKNTNILLVLVLFLFQNARFTAYTSTLTQYISKNFGWKFSETSILLSPLGILNLAVLAALPRASQVLMSRRFRSTVFGTDLFLTQASTLLNLVGALVQGLSSNASVFIMGLFIGTFGSADSPLARATVSHHVDAEHTTRLYALIGMVEVLGSFFGGPALARLFDFGLQRKGVWTGLPWFYVALLCAASLVALLFVEPPGAKLYTDHGLSQSDEDEVSSPAANSATEIHVLRRVPGG
ncbi:major facilitator superfamily protein [Hirsutella rhossiliensis]|uniref:Major facilitator superfamily domain-containing protein n=1 Tax=Hirsutella rhossiliensis TaxID=111463 RepID=A0A9P8SJF1_9HYPO|nr:major facilitator superfamily domain-containing protein [Hirsutella rhossiliensis]KAH0965238.1 major facilitator superfamily domain-containing protein [Hirsutella rhossiliensis]